MRVSKLMRLVFVLSGFALVLSSCETSNSAVKVNYLNVYYLDKVVIDFTSAREPMHVAEIEANYRKASLADGSLSQVGQRFTGAYRDAKRQYLYNQIAIAMEGQIKSQIGAKFKGTKPATMRVSVNNVYIRSRANLAALTGTQVTINGVRRPDDNQLIAGIELLDEAQGLPIDLIFNIQAIDDGSIELFSRDITLFGQSKRMNRMAYDWAEKAAERVGRSAIGLDSDVF